METYAKAQNGAQKPRMKVWKVSRETSFRMAGQKGELSCGTAPG